ncbi:putative holin-like toxin, partial [Bacillus licheniformis]
MAVESALGLMLQFGILIVGILTLAHSFSTKKVRT